MGNTLKKLINITITPGSPGSPGYPGSPGSPAYCITETSCLQVPVVTSTTIVQEQGDENNNGIPNETYIQQQWSYQPLTTTVCFPAVAPTPPIPPTPAVAPSVAEDFQLGWTGAARSSAQITDGTAQFRIDDIAIGAVVGLNYQNEGESYAEIEYGIQAEQGFFWVVEQGVAKTSPVAFATANVFSILRINGVVTYYRNGALIYTSTLSGAASTPMFLDVSLYSGGDAVYDAALFSQVTGAATSDDGVSRQALASGGSGTTVLQALLAFGADATAQQGTGEGSIGPLTSSATGLQTQGGLATLQALTGVGSNKNYGVANSPLQPLTSSASQTALVSPGNLVLGYAIMSPLTNSGVGTTYVPGVYNPAISLADPDFLWVQQQWVGYTVEIISGTGSGQTKTIVDNGFSVLLVDSDWTTRPDATSAYRILDPQSNVVLYGVASPFFGSLQPLSSTGANKNYAAGVATLEPVSGYGIDYIKATQYAALTSPAATLSASGTQGVANSFYGEPVGGFALTAYGGATAQLTAPTPTLTITGTSTVIGSAVLSLRVPALSASGTVSALGRANLELSGFTLQANSGATAALVMPSPGTLSATGLTGGVGSLTAVLPVFQLISSGTVEAYGVAQLVMPALQTMPSGAVVVTSPSAVLVAIGSAVVTTPVTYEAYVLNMLGSLDIAPSNNYEPRGGEVTRYTNFPFNQIVRFNGEYYGVASNGMYRLGGDTDNGSPISWEIETHFADFGKRQLKRANYLYIGGRIGQDPVVKVRAGESADNNVDYDLINERTEDAQTHRRKLGRGLRARYFAVGLSDTTGTEIELDTLDFEFDELKRSL